MKQKELNKVLKLHKKWLDSSADGVKADLQGADLHGADLQWANLRGADLRDADLQGINLQGADLQWANLREADLREAGLRGANLQWASLQGATLQGADLDFSCWPLWCGSVGVVVDKRIAVQLAAHFCAVICDDPEIKRVQKYLKKTAKQSHRAEECKV